MATKKELFAEVNRFNTKYCRSGKNKLTVSQAYGGYQVQLTGKEKKAGGYYKGSLGSGRASVTQGYGNATQTLNALYKSDSKGWLRSNINYYNKIR